MSADLAALQLLLPVESPADHQLTEFEVDSDAGQLCLQACGRAARGELAGLYLYGAPGSGVSHLLQGACAEALSEGHSSQYLPLAELLELDPASLVEALDAVQLLAVDGLEQLRGQDAWQLALFSLYNRVVASNRVLLLGASAPPGQLPLNLEDLRSRLGQLPVFQVPELSDEGKVRALLRRAESQSAPMAEDAARYLLRHTSRDNRALFATLDGLLLYSRQTRRRISLSLLRDYLQGKTVAP